MFFDFVKVFFVFIVLGMPGTLLVWRMSPTKSAEFKALQGWTLSVGVSTILAYYSALWSLSYFYVTWPVWCGACLAVFLVLKPKTSSPTPPSDGLALVVIAGLVFASRLLPVMSKELPLGFDPAFHLLLAKKALILGTHFNDWEPFNPAGLNKPLGFHFLLAAASRIAQVPLHRCYHALLAILGMILSAQTFILAQTLSCRKHLARTAAVVFGFLSVYGSLGYHAWGGVPNMLAMVYFLSIVIVICSSKLHWQGACMVGIQFAALSLVHNHVMLSAGIALSGLTLFWTLRKRHRLQAAWLVASGGIALLLASRHYYGLLTRTSSMGKTDVLKFKEPLFTPMILLQSLGYAFAVILVIALTWIIFATCRKRANVFQTRRWQVLHVAIIILGACFVAGGYLYRWYAWVAHGEDWVAFTPSRFLTNAMPFLCVYAAHAPVALINRFGKELVVYTVLVLVGIGCNWNAWTTAMRPQAISIDEFAALQFIEINTPEEAFVLSSGIWTPYLCYRRTMHTPLPITELYRGRPTFHSKVIQALENPDAVRPNKLYLVSIGNPDMIKLPKQILCTYFSGIAVMRILPPDMDDPSRSPNP